MNKSVSLAIEKAVGTLGSKTSSKEFKDNGPKKPDLFEASLYTFVVIKWQMLRFLVWQ